MTTVRLGYRLDAGAAAVDIPIRNMCVAGQTQEAGKTTALEGLITRSGRRAITFVTKRGEGSFAGARRLRPYFREQADWQFVASILEASRNERLKFERPWIIRASKGARTLQDVANNVKAALEDKKIRGMSQDVYLTLDAYLDVVVPAISRVDWAPGLELEAGVNAMDLTRLPAELQHLVIKSALDWVLEREKDTIVVIPEAWKFMPQGRGTPVKRAAESLIRQGSGIGNYVWIDSQDLGGVEKEILRHCPVWLLGVQREANEIKRTLSNIPAGVAKPTAAAVALLGLGEFFACWSSHAIKTYAQPAWLSDDLARKVAAGELGAGAVRVDAFLEATDYGRLRTTAEDDDMSYRDDAERLAADNADLKKKNGILGGAVNDLQRKVDAMQRELEQLRRPRPGDDVGLVKPDDVQIRSTFRAGPPAPAESAPPGRDELAGSVFDDVMPDAVYRALRARLLEDYVVLQILNSKPAIDLQIKRRTIPVDGDTLRGRVARLMAGGFFTKGRSTQDVRRELTRTGKDPGGGGNLATILADYVDEQFLIRETGSTFMLAPGVDIRTREISAA